MVALVITVIILLMIAGIAIGVLTGNGLFEKIKLAKFEYEDSVSKEKLIEYSSWNIF